MVAFHALLACGTAGIEGSRMEEFVRKHKELLSLEREAEVEESKVAQETLGVKELERRGVRIAKLSVDSVKTGLYGRTLVKFHRSHGKRDSAVPLPPHEISPGLCRKSLLIPSFRGLLWATLGLGLIC